VQRREQFVLLDEQQVAYSTVMRAVEKSYRANTKEVIVVSGGPGSGKSVIALSLMGELSRRGRTVLHATGSSAFTQTLRRVAGARAPRVKSMFKYFNQFVDAERNSLDVLICDEAHRIRESSANRYTPASLRSGRPQVAELIDAARVPVFLLDEHQVVRPGEIGAIADIREAAASVGLETALIELDGQFRCGGSRAYEQWVLRLLGLQPGGPVRWEGDDNFSLSTTPGPSAMEQRLRALLDDGYGARLAAGYCWPWSDPVPGGLKLVFRSVTGTDPGTTRRPPQGFEYDYAGVIIGPDLVWRSDHWVAQPERSHDSQVKRGTASQFDQAVRNTYKVLLTRGMRGTTVFSTDPETQALLENLIPLA